ncbi:LysR family transcriptional regulator [Saccharothrix sp. HUAS TT1]|uniref:LysR family transcriptional regulator n=1 Tax=unclassified Saccharothrix TaxID=2593673 RepID=UPI00345BAA5E
MDVVEACKAFVAVSGHGSFTAGAAAARIPQSVASRRIAALEEHFGARLFTRSSRSVALTPFGREMLPSARRLVDLAEAMEHDAERAKLRPFRIAVPAVCAPRPLARLVADARRHDLDLDPHPAGPGERAELARTLEVRAALVAVPADDGLWRVPLGLAGRDDPGAVSAVYLETLRAGRAERHHRRRRVQVQPEDDVPHVRDRVTRLRDAVGLQPAQVVVATSLVAATADVLGSTDLLLCPPDQAAELGLHWRPLGELDLARGYDVTAGQREDARRVRALPHAAIGRCLGVPEGGAR